MLLLDTVLWRRRERGRVVVCCGGKRDATGLKIFRPANPTLDVGRSLGGGKKTFETVGVQKARVGLYNNADLVLGPKVVLQPVHSIVYIQ